MPTRLPFALILAALVCALFAVPAHARARVFVASYGNDANPCTFTQPCRTFQIAVNTVDAGGEVTAIDSAGFGPILINKAVSITSPNGVEAGIVPVSGGNSITINAGPFDAITLSGLVIDGAGTGANGIYFQSGGYLIMQDCVIRNMTGDGIHFVSNFISHLSVANTFVGKNGGNGILVQPVGSASVDAVFDRVKTQYNGANSWGIALDATLTQGTVTGTATETMSSNNGGGFLAEGGSSYLQLFRSVAANNQTGVQGNGQSVNVLLGDSVIVNNGVGCNLFVASFGDNYASRNACPASAASKF